MTGPTRTCWNSYVRPRSNQREAPRRSPSTPPYMWRMLRELCGHDLMQKITSANRQKLSSLKLLQPNDEVCGSLEIWFYSRPPQSKRPDPRPRRSAWRGRDKPADQECRPRFGNGMTCAVPSFAPLAETCPAEAQSVSIS